MIAYKCERRGCSNTLPCPLHTVRVDLKKRVIVVPGDDYHLAAWQAKQIAKVARLLGEFLKLPGY